MDNVKKPLEEIAELSRKLMTATETLLPFERIATLQLRAVAQAVQLDSQVMSGLLAGVDGQKGNSGGSSQTYKEHYARASDALISALIVVLSDAQLGTIAKRLRETSRERHPEITKLIEAAGLDVEIARRALEKAFKACWLPLFTATKYFDLVPHSGVNEQPAQLLELLRSFHEHPFTVGSSLDRFIEGTPNSRDEILPLKSYRIPIEEAGVSWARACSQEQSLEKLVSAQMSAIKLIWGGGVETLAKVDAPLFNQPTADFSQLAEARTDLSNKLRDSILREQSSLSSMVFVGTESAGKSTFLNAFIGINILPTGYGPTTSYPVRIRHTPGEAEPWMKFGIATLEGNLGRLRAGKWYTRITSMLDLKPRGGTRWEGRDLPVGFDFERLRTQWRALGPDKVARLGQLAQDGFKFVSPVKGADNILRTLGDINDFVRICRNLPMGFDHFDPEEWPIVSLEFPNLRNLYPESHLEIVDIPVEYSTSSPNHTDHPPKGITGSAPEYQWNEMLWEIIRAAKIIVAVVSLQQFGSQTWEDLPQFIAKGTNIRASAVIVTMRDAAPILPEELDSRLQYIRTTFWPHPDEFTANKELLLCSTTEGTAMQVMKQYLTDMTALPTWDALWTSALEPASNKLFFGKMQELYAKHTLESLKDATERLLQQSGLPGAIDALIRMINVAKKQSLIGESEGIVVLSRSIAFDLRRMLAAVGKAPGDVETPSSADDRRASDEAMGLLDSWDSAYYTFLRNVRRVVAAASEGIVDDVENCVSDAITRAWRDMKEDVTPAPLLQDLVGIKDREDVERYMQLYEETLRDSLTSVEQATSQDILKDLHQVHETLFSRLREKVAEIDPSIGEYWPGSLADHKLPSSQLPLVSKDEFLQNAQECRVRYSTMHGFRTLEKRLLRILSNREDVEELLRNLGLISRCLLALVSTVPFLLSLPYWLRQTYVESYKISVNSLRRRLQDTALAHSSDIVNQIEEEVTVFGQLELEVATNAISSSFLVPEGYSLGNALPAVSPAQLQILTGALTNLIAFNTAIGWITESVKRIE